MSNEPKSPQFPEEWLSEEHLDARTELESEPPLAPAVGGWKQEDQVPCGYESPRSGAFLDTPSFDSISDIPDTLVFDDLESDQSLDRQQPGPIDEICSGISDACSAPSVYSFGRVVWPRRNATPTEWYETLTRLSEGSKRKAL